MPPSARSEPGGTLPDGPAWVLPPPSPSRCALTGLGVYLALFLLAPVRVVIEPSASSIAYLAASYLSFFGGCAFRGVLPFKAVSATPPGPRAGALRLLFLATLGLAVLGNALRYYDRSVLRGLSMAEGLLQYREAVESTAVGPISVASAVLYPFSFVALYCGLLWRKASGEAQRGWLLAAGIVFVYPALSTALAGSRSITIVTVSMLFLYVRHLLGFRLSIRGGVLTAALALGLLAFSSAVFLQRVEANRWDVLVSIFESVYAFTVQPTDWIHRRLQGTTSPTGFMAYFTWLHFTQYYIHGIPELFYLIDHFDSVPSHTFGASTFFAAYKLAALVLPLPDALEVANAARPHPGTFTSFFGPLYADFGWFSLVVHFLFGLALQSIWTAVRRGDWRMLPLYEYFVLLVFLFPVVNMIAFAQGLYVIAALCLFTGLAWWVSRRRVASCPPQMTSETSAALDLEAP